MPLLRVAWRAQSRGAGRWTLHQVVSVGYIFLGESVMATPQQPGAGALQTLRSLPPALSRKIAVARSEGDLDDLITQHPPLGPALRQVQAAIFRYMSTPELARQTIEAHPELLTEAADTLLRLLSEVQADRGVQGRMLVGLELLRRCRKDGLEATLPSSEL